MANPFAVGQERPDVFAGSRRRCQVALQSPTRSRVGSMRELGHACVLRLSPRTPARHVPDRTLKYWSNENGDPRRLL
jgi:hypothetical protein